MLHKKIITDLIEREIAGKDYIYTQYDRTVLEQVFREINEKLGISINYLCQMDHQIIPGSGEIIKKYIMQFETESPKAFLVPQMVSDRIENCDAILLQLYLNFRKSNEYISKPGERSPAHICARYDNAFWNMKSKRIAQDLTALVENPRDAFYLPFTTKMLASWKIPSLRNILLSYLHTESLSEHALGMDSNGESYLPPLSYIRRQLKFTAINGLVNYPDEEVIRAIGPHTQDPDVDIRKAAIKSANRLNNSNWFSKGNQSKSFVF